MQLGSRCNEDQDAMRINTLRGSRCNEDQDAPRIKMQQGLRFKSVENFRGASLSQSIWVQLSVSSHFQGFKVLQLCFKLRLAEMIWCNKPIERMIGVICWKEGNLLSRVTSRVSIKRQLKKSLLPFIHRNCLQPNNHRQIIVTIRQFFVNCWKITNMLHSFGQRILQCSRKCHNNKNCLVGSRFM